MIKNIISVTWTELRFLLLKLVYGKKFHYSGIQRFSPNTGISVGKKSTLKLGSKVRAHTGTKIRVRDNASVEIGNDVAFSYNCLLTAHDKIVIGDGCEIGPGVLFYDHDHDVKGHSIKEGLYKTSPIEIGKNVWIGANVIILRGAVIGDDCVIGAGAIVHGGGVPR